MVKNFHISKTRSKEFPYIVYSLDYSRLDDYIFDVSDFLKSKSYKGVVLFDLLLANGLSDRFYSITFNGNTFDFKSIKHINDISENLIITINSYYSKNRNILNDGILNNSEHYLFSKELA